jgi:hypothetical protein
MKRFVIFGDIEFLDNHHALIHNIKSAEFIADADIEPRAMALDNCDFIAPHYCSCRITFAQYHEEK